MGTGQEHVRLLLRHAERCVGDRVILQAPFRQLAPGLNTLCAVYVLCTHACWALPAQLTCELMTNTGGKVVWGWQGEAGKTPPGAQGGRGSRVQAGERAAVA